MPSMGLEGIKVLYSIIFVLLGCATFYVSTLISGHNIYRDLPLYLSTLLTTAIGASLFIFSPISFVIIFPQLFIPELFASGNKGPTPDTILKIHNLLFHEVLPPYLLSACGVGLIVGSFTVIKARRIILVWLRRKLYSRVFSYL